MGRRPFDVYDYDEVAVRLMMSGEFKGEARHADVAELVRRLTPLGYSDGQIAYLANRKSRRGIMWMRAKLNIETRCGGPNQGVPDVPTLSGHRY